MIHLLFTSKLNSGTEERGQEAAVPWQHQLSTLFGTGGEAQAQEQWGGEDAETDHQFNNINNNDHFQSQDNHHDHWSNDKSSNN